MSRSILHVVDSFRPEAGTLGLSARLLTGTLLDRGISIEIVVGTAGESESDAGTMQRKVPPFDRALAGEKVRRCDVVHIHGWGYEAARCLAREARRAGKPYVITPCGGLTHGFHRPPDWGDRVRGWFGGDALVRGAGALIAQHEYEARSLASRTQVERVHVVPYGLNCDEFEATSIQDAGVSAPSGERTLLVLAPIEPMFGGVTLLRAMAELGADADGWRVVLAGPVVQDWHKQMVAAVQRKGCADRVSFAAAPDITSQRAWLEGSVALIAVGLHVHTPISIVQALACGVPVLATDMVVPDGLNDSLVVCRADRAAICSGLRDLLHFSDEKRKTLGRRGHESVRARLDGAILVEKLLDVYGCVTQGTGLPVSAPMA